MRIHEQYHSGCMQKAMPTRTDRTEIIKREFMGWGKEVMPMVFIECGECVGCGILQITEEFFRNIGDGIHKYIFQRGLRTNGCTLHISTLGRILRLMLMAH